MIIHLDLSICSVIDPTVGTKGLSGIQQAQNKMGESKSRDPCQDMEGKIFQTPPQDDALPPQNSISLADVMSKLEVISTLSQKIDSMAEDIKQIRVIQDATEKIGKDLTETRAYVKELQGSITKLQESNTAAAREHSDMQNTIIQLKSTVASLEEERVENRQNQQALAKELLTLRAQIHTQSSANIVSRMEFEHLKIEAALRKNNLVFEGIQEDYNGRNCLNKYSPSSETFWAFQVLK